MPNKIDLPTETSAAEADSVAASGCAATTGSACPRCGAPRTKTGQPSRRVFFACDSYAYENDNDLTDQTDLCETRQRLNDANEKLGQMNARYVILAHAVQDWWRAKGRYNTQLAACKLAELVGEKPTWPSQSAKRSEPA